MELGSSRVDFSPDQDPVRSQQSNHGDPTVTRKERKGYEELMDRMKYTLLEWRINFPILTEKELKFDKNKPWVPPPPRPERSKIHETIVDEIILSEKGKVKNRTTSIDEMLDIKPGSSDASIVTTPAPETLQPLSKNFNNESSADNTSKLMLDEIRNDMKSLNLKKAMEEVSNRPKKGEIFTALEAINVEAKFAKLLKEFIIHTHGSRFNYDAATVIDLAHELADGVSVLKILGKSNADFDAVAQNAQVLTVLSQLSRTLYFQAFSLLLEAMSVFRSNNSHQ